MAYDQKRVAAGPVEHNRTLGHGCDGHEGHVQARERHYVGPEGLGMNITNTELL